ncbi:hypothetical protein Hanom_Chr15g01410731 [Helianthus anomalus]
MPMLARIFQFPSVKWFLNLRSSTTTATDAIQGLVSANELLFSVACATKTPSFTTHRSATLNGFRKVVLVVTKGLWGQLRCSECQNRHEPHVQWLQLH